MRAVPLHDPSKEDVTCPRVARIRNTPPWLLCREISSLARLSQENSDETGQDFCQYGLAAPNMIAVIGGSATSGWSHACSPSAKERAMTTDPLTCDPADLPDNGEEQTHA